MQPRRSLLLVAVVALALVWARPAIAQNHPSFDEAMQLMRDGQFDRACPKLEEALAAEGTMIVRFRLAECYEQIGKLASAFTRYREVAGEAALTDASEREAFAKKKALELEPRVPRLKLLVPPEVGAVTTLNIAVDDQSIERNSWSNDIMLDMGTHAITVTGSGYRTWTFTFELKTEREIRTIQVPNQTIPVAPAPPPAPRGPAPDEGGGGLAPQTIAGITVGAAGVVMMAIGIGMGVAAKGQFDDSLSGCNAQDQCDASAIAAQESAVTEGNAATAIFIIGAVATAGGVVLWLLAPSNDDVALGVTPTGAELRLRF